MKTLSTLSLLFLCSLGSTAERFDIILAKNAPPLEKTAAKELASLLRKVLNAEVTLAIELPKKPQQVILLGNPETNPTLKQLAGKIWPKLSGQGHLLKSIKIADGSSALIVGGGSPVATLWAVYELGHRLGIRSLLDRDMMPVQTPKLPKLDVVMEPRHPERAWETLGRSPIGSVSWGLTEHQRVITQLAKMKINRLVIRIHPLQPFVDYKIEGVNKKSAYLWQRAQRFRVDGDTAGRAVFQGAKYFDNPDFQNRTKYDERTKAGIKLVRGIIESAHQVGMTTELSISPTEFPFEFGSILSKLNGLKLIEAIRTRIRAYIKTYPNADALTLRPYPDTTQRKSSIQGLQAALKDKTLSKGIEIRLDSKPSRKVVTLSDVRLGLMPHMMSVTVPKSNEPYLIRSALAGDLLPDLYYLTRASFNAKLTSESALKQLVDPMCGEGVVPRIAKAFGMIRKATAILKKNSPRFTEIKPDILVKHVHRKKPTPKWMTEVKDLYLSAMNEMYRANTRARKGGRYFSLYFARQFEFAFHTMSAVESLCQVGASIKAKKKDEATENLEKALESIYEGLSALSAVARSNSDRAVIAVLNEYGYRAIQKELEQ